MSTQIFWDAIEAITHGRLGRTMATCPLCSETRRTPQKRHNKVLAVNLLEPDFAIFFCNHCEAPGCNASSSMFIFPNKIVEITN